MEKLAPADIERQALLERLSDPNILPVITLGIGKGNFAEGKIIADSIKWLVNQGCEIPYHSGMVLKLDDVVNDPLDIANIRALQTGHSIIARRENAATVYSWSTEKGSRQKGLIRPSAAKEIAIALAKRPNKEVICTSSE